MTDTDIDQRRARRGERIAIAIEAVLVVAAFVVGAVLNARGVHIYAESAPIFGRWQPHLGWGTPFAVAVAGLVVWQGPAFARRATWPLLMTGGYLTAVAWTLSLALVDGWSDGIATRLTIPGEYLTEVAKVTDIGTTLTTFTDHILDFQPTSWATHVAGHPPGALLTFVALDRIGLGGGGPAALLCILAGATITISIPATLRALGDQVAARTVLPYLVLFPGAIWIGASADGLYTGVVAAGLALLTTRQWWWTSPLAGLTLGYALYLSYGLVLVAPLALTVVALRRHHRLHTLLTATAGAATVIVAFTASGFWWLNGYHLVVPRYYQGWGAERPYTYWIWANLAALTLTTGPILAPALYRAGRHLATLRIRRPDRHGWPRIRGAATRMPTVWLPLAAAAAVAAADLSGLSKAEVERIWLPFAVWLLVAADGSGSWRGVRRAEPESSARIPRTDQRIWLAVQAATALAVNHLLWTNW